MLKELSNTGKALLRASLGPETETETNPTSSATKSPHLTNDHVMSEIHRVRHLGRCKTSLGGVWSPMQEKQLVAAVSECGEDWDEVCGKVAGHSGIECKQRWTNLTQQCSIMMHANHSQNHTKKHAKKLALKLTGSLPKGLVSRGTKSSLTSLDSSASASSSQYVPVTMNAVDGHVLMVVNKVVNCPTTKQISARRVRCYVRLDVEGYRFHTKVERRGGITEDGQVVDLRNVVTLPHGITAQSVLKFKVMLKHRVIQDELVGRAKIQAGVLFERKERRLVLVDEDDYIVMNKARPVMLELKLVASSLPESWPQPAPSRVSRRNALTEQYPRHVMIITRGTRGDVQPFIALARGLAETLGWKITICTELCYRDYIKRHSNVSRGSISFRPSGGNTQKRVDSDTARWAVSFESTSMQTIMLAWAEREFFQSEPAMFYWAEQLQPDLLLFGFTVTNVAMIISEALNIPLMGFILQPTCMPSEQYPPVFPLNQDKYEKWRDEMRGKSAHDTLTQVKGVVENTQLKAMRHRHGIHASAQSKISSRTWEQIASANIPVVVPISPYAFGGRPKDWHSNALLTTYIFLKGKTVPELKPSLETFLGTAKENQHKVVVLAFSSMPIEQADIFEITLKILTKCKAKVSVVALIGDHSNDAPLKEDVQKQVEAMVNRKRLFIDKGAPFGRLFPRVDAIVAHGGLGTTADAIAAKVPVIVTGVMLFDQRFWGARCFEMGIGPYPLHIQRFPSQCTEIIDHALAENSPWAAKAKEHGTVLAEIMQEDPSGVLANVNTVSLLEQLAVPYIYVDQEE